MAGRKLGKSHAENSAAHRHPPKPEKPAHIAAFRKPPVELTEEIMDKFLVLLRASGMKYLSAEGAGVCYNTIKNRMKVDPVFAEAHDRALEGRLDELESAALGRALDGVDEPVIGGQFKDEIVTHVRKYSDSLAMFILKAKRAEFREKLDVQANITGGVLIVPGRPKTSEEWEAEQGQAAKGLGHDS